MHREESTEEQAMDHEDSKEEMGEDDSDLSKDCCESSSWGSLPDVCLQNVFRFLPDNDHKSAATVCHHWHDVIRSPSLTPINPHYTNHITSQSKGPTAFPHLRRLELDRPEWPPRIRNSLINNLICFFHRGASKLSSVRLSRMRNNML